MAMNLGCSTTDLINGVPMKLNDKFRPLPKYEVPYASDNTLLFPESIFDEEIDFTIERKAIDDFVLAQNCQSLVKSYSSPSLSVSEAQSDLETAATDSSCDVSSLNCFNNSSSSIKSTNLSLSRSQPQLQHPYLNNGIMSPLQPIPADLTSNNFSSPLKTINNIFKLEDFEMCQSSPFDAVELKTLNVYEELRQVLQGQNQTTVADQQQPNVINGHRHHVHNFQ